MDEYPSITLAGKAYPVKPLVVKQLRVVVPTVMRLRSLSLGTMTESQFDDLVEVVYLAVCPCQDKLTRDAFTDLPITPIELMQALPVIMAQAGMTPKKKEAAQGEAPAGQ